jgi:protein-tyrosine-phosphatase
MEKDKEKFKVLFVCTGNSCRSPMAEGILKKMLEENKLDNFEVGSAGTSSLDGAFPSLFAIEVAKAQNVDLTQHRSHQLNQRILRKADLILSMSNEHLEQIRTMNEKALKKTYLLKTFPQHHPVSPPEAPAGHPSGEDLSITENENKSPDLSYIKDPIGGSMDDYNQCFWEIEKEIRRIFPELIRKAGKKNFKNQSSCC